MEFLKKHKMIVIAIIVIAIGLGAYFMFFKKKDGEAGETAKTLGGGSATPTPATSSRVTSSNPKIQAVIDEIYASLEWMNHVKDKAKKEGISVEERILKDAQWTVEQRSKK
jgi:flagellar basal body-associated protein FliL